MTDCWDQATAQSLCKRVPIPPTAHRFCLSIRPNATVNTSSDPNLKAIVDISSGELKVTGGDNVIVATGPHVNLVDLSGSSGNVVVDAEGSDPSHHGGNPFGDGGNFSTMWGSHGGDGWSGGRDGDRGRHDGGRGHGGTLKRWVRAATTGGWGGGGTWTVAEVARPFWQRPALGRSRALHHTSGQPRRRQRPSRQARYDGGHGDDRGHHDMHGGHGGYDGGQHEMGGGTTTMVAGTGNETMIGGNGNYLFEVGPHGGNDDIIGGKGNNTVVFDDTRQRCKDGD